MFVQFEGYRDDVRYLGSGGMFTDSWRRPTCGRVASSLGLEVSENQPLLVVELTEYLVLTQVVTITDTKPDNGTSLITSQCEQL